MKKNTPIRLTISLLVVSLILPMVMTTSYAKSKNYRGLTTIDYRNKIYDFMWNGWSAQVKAYRKAHHT